MFFTPRVVLAGCGGIARAHLKAIPAASIAALCDQNLDAARALRDEFGLHAPVFKSLEEALEREQPDVVLVCTPPATHFDLVRLALESGASVLCEKPLATRASDAQVLVELARAQNKMLRTSAKYRFCEGVAAAKSLLDSGEAGLLQTVRVAFGAPFEFENSWHANTLVSGGGVWMDNGPHALDLARFFAGELRFTSLEEWQTEGALETQTRVCLRSAGGAGVQIALSWKRFRGENFAVLNCERGTARIGWGETLWQPHGASERILAGGYDKSACFAAQWNGFLNGDTRFEGADGARVVELVEAVYTCAR
jgi:predicted dehydrogenase